MVVVAPGRVLFAKNSDRDPNEAQLLDWQPRRSYPPASRVRCTWIEIDQVPETQAVLLSRPFWMWGAEMGANEHGLVIGNEAVFTDQPYAKVGLTGMDLLRLALERATNSQEAVAVITELLERHGQGGGCGHEDRDATYHNSFLIADAHSASVLETAGALWQVEHVEQGARSISNGLTIPGFADHATRVKTHFSASATRRSITEQGAACATTVADLMAVLRSHGAGGKAPHYTLLTGGMGAPCMHAGGMAAASQSTASWVAELLPDGDHRHWVTATAAPCTGLFKPVRVTEPLDLGPDPVDRYDPRTLWWRHEVLHRAVMRNPVHLLDRYAAERDEVERRWIAHRPAPGDAFAEADDLLARWTALTVDPAGRDTRPPWVRHYWRTRNRRAGLPPRTGTPRTGTPRT